ncbi:MAG: hypothetical protein ABIH83_04720 [Candidatus Micrarchaeota archaeon]
MQFYKFFLAILIFLTSFNPLFASPFPNHENITSSNPASLAFPDHQAVASHNLALLPSLNHSSTLPPNISFSTPSLSTPFSYAYFKFLGALPSVSNHISSTHPPQMIWTWGEYHPAYLIDTAPSFAGCPENIYELSATGPPIISGNMLWNLQNKTKTTQINSNTQQIISSPFSNSDFSSLSTLEGENKTAILPNLTLTFEGQVIVPFRVDVQVYTIEYSTMTTSSGDTIEITACKLQKNTYTKNYSIPISDSASWQVEYSEPIHFLLQPIDKEQLSTRPQIKLLFFSNRLAQNMTFSLNNNTLPSARFADYYEKEDEFGLLWIERNSLNNITSEKNNSILFSNYSSLFLNPTAFDKSNLNYSFQYYAFLRTPLPLGYSNISLSFTDDFNNTCSSSWKIQTRAAAGISGFNSTNAEIILTDENAPPPEIKKQKSGNTLSLRLPSTEKTRPTKEFFFSPLQLPNIILSLSLFLIFLLGLRFFSR